ncbi:tyrosine-type recombinase/integrase [Methylobacterium sp. B4]|uniref:tyrosine-type recombinase/integrase n=1 Tax=Methylobacterium sp. B4 TaxID=1938755 RepID=UPI0015E89B93|nr:tyrosine-type recombinase/integrase [Methylobacterium sp. B4]
MTHLSVPGDETATGTRTERRVRRKATSGKLVDKGKWVEKRDNSPNWQMVFSLYKKRHSRTSETGNKREAERKAREWRDELIDKHVRVHGKRGVPTKQRDARLLDAADWFWKHKASKDVGAGDVRTVLNRIVDILKPHTLLSDITDETVIGLIATLEGYDHYDDPSRGKMTDSRVDQHVTTLRRLMRNAVEMRKFYLPDMPAWPHHVIVRHPRTQEWSVDEVDAVTASWRDDLRPALVFLFESALRLTNAIELKWADVDLDAGVIRVRVKTVRKHGRKRRIEVENRKVREVVISKMMREILDHQVGKHPESVFTFVSKSTRVNHYGRSYTRGEHYPLNVGFFQAYWVAVRANHGLQKLCLHDLRRTRGSWLYRATGNIKLVKEFLHHADIGVTERVYAHTASEQMIEGMELVSEYEAKLRERHAARTGRPLPVRRAFADSAEVPAEVGGSEGGKHCGSEGYPRALDMCSTVETLATKQLTDRGDAGDQAAHRQRERHRKHLSPRRIFRRRHQLGS